MKNRIAILTDTNSGLSPEQAKAHGIDMVPMPVVINDEPFFEYQSIDQNEFFNRLRQGASVRTSQPTPYMLMEIWDRLLETNDHIIYLLCLLACLVATKPHAAWHKNIQDAFFLWIIIAFL